MCDRSASRCAALLREHMQLFGLSEVGRLGHTWRGLLTDLRCLPAICRHCVDVPCAQQTAVVCAEYDSLSRLPQQMRPRRWRGQMLSPGLPSGQRALDPA